MIKRLPIQFKANHDKVLMLPFFPGSTERAKRVIERVLALPQTEQERVLAETLQLFSNRHKNFLQILENNFIRIKELLPEGITFHSVTGKLLAAYFSKEYSTQSAALFNPSIVLAPDQQGLSATEARFILSLRATGESHISSIAFREGVLSTEGTVSVLPDSRFCVSPATKTQYLHERFANSPELLDANYDISFHGAESVSERVIFPSSPSESNGIEDVRFVSFIDENGRKEYLGTYTAYNGKRIFPQLIQTKDFKNFSMRTLQGVSAADKGMGIFPRKVNGAYMICSRIDGENLYIMQSDSLYTWESAERIRVPQYDWEFVQVGNCGSPVEVDEGWLLITHAVGAFRRYVISAVLLDKANPNKVIGVLDKPLLEPDETEREGYVPNVVYSCGSLLYGNYLFLPYAMSDSQSGFAVCEYRELLNNMKQI